VPIALEVQVDDLAGGMNPGVGPTGGADTDTLAAESRDGCLQRVLDRRPVGLCLEADVGTAIVF
jgi:hypothetical protein